MIEVKKEYKQHALGLNENFFFDTEEDAMTYILECMYSYTRDLDAETEKIFEKETKSSQCFDHGDFYLYIT